MVDLWYDPDDSVFANVDVDAKPNAPLTIKYGVSLFSTLIFFPKDYKEGILYEGGHSKEDFVNFLNEKCGTQCTVGGGLNEKVQATLSL